MVFGVVYFLLVSWQVLAIGVLLTGGLWWSCGLLISFVFTTFIKKYVQVFDNQMLDFVHECFDDAFRKFLVIH